MDGPGTGIIINASNIVSVCEAGNVPGQTSTRAMRLGGGFFNQQRGGISIALMQGYKTPLGVCGFIVPDYFSGQVNPDDGTVADMYEYYDAVEYEKRYRICITNGNGNVVAMTSRQTSSSPLSLCQEFMLTYGRKQCNQLPLLAAAGFSFTDEAASITYNLSSVLEVCNSHNYSEDYIFAANGSFETSQSSAVFSAVYGFTVQSPKLNGPCSHISQVYYKCTTQGSKVKSISFNYDGALFKSQMDECGVKSRL